MAFLCVVVATAGRLGAFSSMFVDFAPTALGADRDSKKLHFTCFLMMDKDETARYVCKRVLYIYCHFRDRIGAFAECQLVLTGMIARMVVSVSTSS